MARGQPGGELLDRLEPDTGERRELHQAVDHILDAARQSLEVAGMVDREDVQAAEAVVLAHAASIVRSPLSVLDVSDAVEDEQRPTLDPDVPGVAERREMSS